MSGTVTGLDLDRLEELAEKATEGPWTVEADGAGEFYHVEDAYDLRSPDLAVTDGGPIEEGGPSVGALLRHDAEFIAEFRNAVPSLLAAARAVQAVRELHAPMNRPNHSSVLCHECVVLWPCATVAALGTEQEGQR